MLATDHHVVSGLEVELHHIRLHNGSIFSARVVGYDEGADVALLKVSGRPGDKFAALDLGSPLSIGSKRAAAMGFPQTGDGAAVIAFGRFTHAAFTDHSRLYFDMKTYFGHSGGPILGRDGKVISVVKNGVEAGEFSAPETIGSNIEHLRSLITVVRDRGIESGPLSIDSEILERGRRMLSAKEILGLSNKPEIGVRLQKDLSVKVIGRTAWAES